MRSNADGQNIGRPPVLDQIKRQKILAILANGSSRRVAAQYVGVATSTVIRTAQRDPDFAAELARAEQNAEIDALHFLRRAARKDRYWRAAAWLLERRNPEDFAPRPLRLFTEEQVRQLFVVVGRPFAEEMPEENFARAMQRLDEWTQATPEQLAAAARPRPRDFACDAPPAPWMETEDEEKRASADPSDEVPADTSSGEPSDSVSPPTGRGFATHDSEAAGDGDENASSQLLDEQAFPGCDPFL
jgi:hypothetical protein